MHCRKLGNGLNLQYVPMRWLKNYKSRNVHEERGVWKYFGIAVLPLTLTIAGMSSFLGSGESGGSAGSETQVHRTVDPPAHSDEDAHWVDVGATDDASSHLPAVGKASYYGRGFAGRPTANGEIFDPNALTAAHRTLPFGSSVLVTNQSNGRQVIVRINDRGPFVKGRIVDLSEEAARKIGMIRSGTATVRLERVK